NPTTLFRWQWQALAGAIVLLFCSGAWASGGITVLQLTGDGRGVVRGQVERALGAKGANVVKAKTYDARARKLGWRGSDAYTVAAISTLAEALSFASTVRGEVTARTLSLEVVGAEGSRLGSESFPLRQGKLSPKDAFRAASAILTILESAPAPSASQDGS